jgi:hypothetical protein
MPRPRWLPAFALVQEIRAWFDGPLALAGAIATGDAILAAQAMAGVDDVARPAVDYRLLVCLGRVGFLRRDEGGADIAPRSWLRGWTLITCPMAMPRR